MLDTDAPRVLIVFSQNRWPGRSPGLASRAPAESIAKPARYFFGETLRWEGSNSFFRTVCNA